MPVSIEMGLESPDLRPIVMGLESPDLRPIYQCLLIKCNLKTYGF
jgi:hypothetical protein